MDRTYELQTERITKLLLKYIIPTVTGMLVAAIHIFIDGIFVGRGIGSVGVAAVNIVVPLFTVYTGLGLLVGIGGSTLVSNQFARQKFDEARKIFTQSTMTLVLISIVFMTITLLFIEPIAMILGSNEAILPLVKEYLVVILLLTPIFIMSTALTNFVRADGAPKFAMICTLIGAVINGTLDYVAIFILKWGLTGAAIATGAGNIISLIMMVIFFQTKRGNLYFVKIKFDLEKLKEIMFIGVPSFLAEIGISIVTLAHNIMMMKLAGAVGVSAYGVVNYIYPLMLMIFLGLTMSMQPVISYNHGALKIARVKEAMILVFKIALVSGILFFLSGIFFSESMVKLFIVNEENVIQLASRGIRIFFSNYIFLGLNLAVVMYFQCTERPKISAFITILRSVIIVLACLFILPKFLGTDGVWLSVPIAEGLTFLYIVYEYKFKLKKEKHETEVKNYDIIAG
ncbi:MAG: MATE family efflux transporter [Clostridia bacterium]|nr:MATE family efflux transporter [Clostridia bacterium]